MDLVITLIGLSIHSSFGSCTFAKPRNTITLSEPVLKYLLCTDRKNALLHEMIHAIIYVKCHRKDSCHGPLFRAWMDAINSCSIKDHQRPDGQMVGTISPPAMISIQKSRTASRVSCGSANLVEIHFLGLQTRVLHLMPAALRMLTAAAADPVGTCFVTGTTTRMTAVAHTKKQSWNQMHYLKREFQEVLSYF